MKEPGRRAGHRINKLGLQSGGGQVSNQLLQGLSLGYLTGFITRSGTYVTKFKVNVVYECDIGIITSYEKVST